MNEKMDENIELERLREQERNLADILDSHVPRMLYHSASLPGIDLAGFSLAQNGLRGGDLAFPILFLAPEDENKYSLKPVNEKSSAIVHKIKKGPSRAGLFMADATGHREVDGVMAAMAYHAGRVALHYELRERDDVSSHVARAMNDTFYLGQPSSLPVSLLLARFEADSNEPGSIKGSYISAGNPYPCILRAGQSKLERADISKVNISAALGVMPTDSTDNSYKPNRFRLYKDDIMLLYSDGFVDLGRQDGQPYFPHQSSKEINWAEKLLEKHRNGSAAEIAHAFQNDILTYSLHREDDVSLFIAKGTSL